ncbi:hypothetical protein [Sphingosinithalassobacter sp. CS137]|uniref:hypothetical protein n=1 Tax=Sphingosinithalassobacter sp. CS137 TaxID=2762748 RepID=UPI0021D16101
MVRDEAAMGPCLRRGDGLGLQNPDGYKAWEPIDRAGRRGLRRGDGLGLENPDGYKAWEPIDRAGRRGLRRGAAQVSEKHMNFPLNLGAATSGIALEGEIRRARVAVRRNRRSREGGSLSLVGLPRRSTQGAGDVPPMVVRDEAAMGPCLRRGDGLGLENPGGYKAWEPIGWAGRRGLRRGAAQVSEKHMNFLRNVSAATSGIALEGEIRRARVAVRRNRRSREGGSLSLVEASHRPTLGGGDLPPAVVRDETAMGPCLRRGDEELW